MIANLHPCPNHPEILLRPGETCPKCQQSHKRRPWLIGGILGGLIMILCLSAWIVYASREGLFPLNLIINKATPTLTGTSTPSLTASVEDTSTPTLSPTRTRIPTRTRQPTRTTMPSWTYSPLPEVVTETLPPTQAPTRVPPTREPTREPTEPPPPPPPTDTPEPIEPTHTAVNP